MSQNPTKSSRKPQHFSIVQCVSQMTEMATMAGAAASVISCGVGLAIGAYLLTASSSASSASSPKASHSLPLIGNNKIVKDILLRVVPSTSSPSALINSFPKLFAATAAVFTAQMLGIKAIANGHLTPSNRRSNAVMEMYLKRLDAFVQTGVVEEEKAKNAKVVINGSSAADSSSQLLLTPLAVITGVTCGLGKYTAENLLTCGWKIVMACRDLAAAEKTRAVIIAAAQQRLRARYARELSASSSSSSNSSARLRAEQIIAMLPHNITIYPIDTNDYDSIRSLAASLVLMEKTAGIAEKVSTTAAADSSSSSALFTYHDGLRLLHNNAGLFLPGYSQFSSLGIQKMFNINYAGPAYLTYLVERDIIHPRVQKEMKEAAEGEETSSASASSMITPFRTVNLGSCANLWALGLLKPRTHEEAVGMMKGILDAVADPTQNKNNNKLIRGMGYDTYGISKLGMIALAFNTANKERGLGFGQHITAFSLHPGGVRTRVFRRVKGVAKLFFGIFSRIVFKQVRYGANNQTYLCLVPIHEQRESDPLTTSVIANSNDKNSKQKKKVRATEVGPLNASVISAASSGQFLIDAGEGKGGAVSCVTNAEVFQLFDDWTAAFIEKCEAKAE